jgi:hypothetical protein
MVKMISFLLREVIKMKNQLLIALMALASLLFIANGASAQYCSACSYQGAAGFTADRGSEEMSPATSSNTVGNVEIVPAVPSKEEAIEEFTPAGSSSHKEYMTPKNAPYEAPAESQSY